MPKKVPKSVVEKPDTSAITANKLEEAHGRLKKVQERRDPAVKGTTSIMKDALKSQRKKVLGLSREAKAKELEQAEAEAYLHRAPTLPNKAATARQEAKSTREALELMRKNMDERFLQSGATSLDTRGPTGEAEWEDTPKDIERTTAARITSERRRVALDKERRATRTEKRKREAREREAREREAREREAREREARERAKGVIQAAERGLQTHQALRERAKPTTERRIVEAERSRKRVRTATRESTVGETAERSRKRVRTATRESTVGETAERSRKRVRKAKRKVTVRATAKRSIRIRTDKEEEEVRAGKRVVAEARKMAEEAREAAEKAREAAEKAKGSIEAKEADAILMKAIIKSIAAEVVVAEATVNLLEIKARVAEARAIAKEKNAPGSIRAAEARAIAEKANVRVAEARAIAEKANVRVAEARARAKEAAEREKERTEVETAVETIREARSPAVIFEELLERAKRESFAKLRENFPVMVFGNEGENTVVLKAMREFARSRGAESDEHFAAPFAQGGSLLRRFASEINAQVNESIDEAIRSEALTNLSPSEPDNGKTTYEHEGASLVQTGDDEHGYKFKPKGNFNGVVRVQRKGADGQLLEDQLDVVEYKNGKPIAVSLATQGECRIADIGLLQEQARGVAVSAERTLPSIQITGRGEVERGGQLTAPSTPVVTSRRSARESRRP